MNNLCRTCLGSPQKLVQLQNNTGIIIKIEAIASIKVIIHDNLPNSCCEECVSNINKLYTFRTIVRNSDLELRNRLEELENAKLTSQNFNEPQVKKEPDVIEIEPDEDEFDFVKIENIKSEMPELLIPENVSNKFFSHQVTDNCNEGDALSELMPLVESTTNIGTSNTSDMSFFGTAHTDNISDMPPDLVEESIDVQKGLLPDKSRKRYEAAYQSFSEWQKLKNTTSISENIMLEYFSEYRKKYKPSTMWSQYSMLRTVINVDKNIDISHYNKLKAYLRKESVGFKSTKSLIFTLEQLQKFLIEAPDFQYLGTKVIAIFGIAGARRGQELVNLRIEDVEHHGNVIIVRIPDSKSHMRKSYTIEGKFAEIVRKYEALRPANVCTNRYFLSYRKGLCTKQVIGINKFAKIPKEIATYLKLPEPHLYTGHSFRRTSAIILADNGADIAELRRHGKWKSFTVVKGHVEDSVRNKLKIGNLLSSTINLEASTSNHVSDSDTPSVETQ